MKVVVRFDPPDAHASAREWREQHAVVRDPDLHEVAAADWPKGPAVTSERPPPSCLDPTARTPRSIVQPTARRFLARSARWCRRGGAASRRGRSSASLFARTPRVQYRAPAP